MNSLDSSSSAHDVDDNVMLLRFSSELRTHLQEDFPEEVSTLVELEQTEVREEKPPSRRKWLWVLAASIVLLSCVGLLEIGYHPPPADQTQSAAELRQRQHSRTLFKQLRSRKAQIQSHVFLSTMKNTLRSLQTLEQQHCLQNKAVKVQWPTTLRWGSPVLEPVRRLVSTLFQGPYNRLRRKTSPGRGTAWKQQKKLCLQRTEQLRNKVMLFLRRKEKSFLRQARVHLRFFGWCRTTWLRKTYTPQQEQKYERFRKSRRCQTKCWGRRFRSGRCRRCWESWQKETSLSKQDFRTQFRFVQREKLRQCRVWRNGRTAAGGVFHLGAYFWRVQRVLTMQNVLEELKLCGETCQKVRAQWGFRLQVKTEPKQAQMFLALWSKAHKAPTATLQKLSQQVLVADGKERWFPAIRTKALKTRVIPQDLWYLYHFYDPKTRKRAVWPIAPTPGSRIVHKVKLSPIRIQSDGRQGLRFVRFSRDGKWLAYVVEKNRPWIRGRSQVSPLCRGIRTRGAFLSTIYLKKIKDDLFQNVQYVFQLRTRARIRSMLLGGEGESLFLLLHTNHPPVSLSRTNWDLKGQKGGLWKVPLFPTLGAVGVFGKPRALLAAAPNAIDIPVQGSSSKVVAFRRSCPSPKNRVVLFQTPVTQNPWNLTLPPSYSLSQVVRQSSGKVSLLLQKGDLNAKRSFFLREIEPSSGTQKTTSPVSTGGLFRQMAWGQGRWFFGGGAFGTPLKQWDSQGWQKLQSSHPSIRYLDPVVHPVTGRLYLLQHWKVQGSRRPHHRVSFLVSMVKKAR